MNPVKSNKSKRRKKKTLNESKGKRSKAKQRKGKLRKSIKVFIIKTKTKTTRIIINELINGNTKKKSKVKKCGHNQIRLKVTNSLGDKQ